MGENTVRLTTAQAIIRYLNAQFIETDGTRQRLCGGGFGIFGHGNVTCLGEALYDHKETLPLCLLFEVTICKSSKLVSNSSSMRKGIEEFISAVFAGGTCNSLLVRSG